MKQKKLIYRAVVSLVLSAIFLTMPAVTFTMNENHAVKVRAEDLTGDTSGQDVQKSEQESANKENENAVGTEESTTSNAEDTEKEAEESTAESDKEAESGADNVEESKESETEESTEGTVSGNDTPKPVCNCEEKCGAYSYNKDCEICVGDYKECTYKTPNVVITIHQPEGWHSDTTSVTFGVRDVAATGNFDVAKIQAKVGQNGSWTDVTEDKKLNVSENCTIYVQVTDQKGRTYEKNRAIKCFDTVRPTLNAAVSDGLLSIQVHDTDSGAKAVYVNGYEFTELTNGTLNVRLQQFDAGYEYFTISAMDNAGNMSEVYKTKNPYYKAPDDESDENPAEQLPVSAEASKPGSATGIVTEHTKTDSAGNTTSQTTLTPAEQKKQAMAEASVSEQAETEKKETEEAMEQGKEFYTIQTASDKVFYLIIDRDGEEEMVYFLTEITENDLLNTTTENSETLPKNSAALESAIPTTDEALPNNNTEQKEEAPEPPEEPATEEVEEPEPEPERKEEPNPVISYVLIGGLAAAVIGCAYYFKVVRKKKEDFIEDEDEEDEEQEVFENEDEEIEENSDERFLRKQEEE